MVSEIKEKKEAKRIEFFLPMKIPTVTNQMHRIGAKKANGQTIIYDTPELKTAKAKFTVNLYGHAPKEPLEGAVRLVTKWLFPISGKHQDGEWKTTKPDTDNLIKLFKDCMAHCGYFVDDAQVASEITEKFWAEKTGVYVCVEEIP